MHTRYRWNSVPIIEKSKSVLFNSFNTTKGTTSRIKELQAIVVVLWDLTKRLSASIGKYRRQGLFPLTRRGLQLRKIKNTDLLREHLSRYRKYGPGRFDNLVNIEHKATNLNLLILV